VLERLRLGGRSVSPYRSLLGMSYRGLKTAEMSESGFCTRCTSLYKADSTLANRFRFKVKLCFLNSWSSAANVKQKSAWT